MRPQAELPCINLPKAVEAVCGGLAGLLGFAAIAGRALHSPLFFSMEPGTAIGFVLSGMALLGIAACRPRFTFSCAAISAISAFGFALGQDRIPPTAIFAFLVLGTGLVLAHFIPAGGKVPAMGITGMLTLVIGATCIANAVSGTCDPFSWRSMTCVSAGAAAGFVLLGIGVIVAAFRLTRIGPREAVWIPIGIGVSLAVFRAGVWHVVHGGPKVNADAVIGIAVTRGVVSAVTLGLAFRLGLTARLRSEALTISNRRLEEEIVQRKRAEETAQEANRTKSAFLANMSHEIRTPMNGVLGMVSLALDSAPDGEQRECLLAAKESAESLVTVINDILDFSKIEAGKLSLEQVGFGLRDSLAQALKPLSLSAEQKGLYLRWHVDPEVTDEVMGDPIRLRQIIVNLVGNAIKFTTSGGVTVSVRNESQDAERTSLHFMVKDTGIGIPSNRQQEIFSSFTQADNSTSRQYGGTGLGLAISRELTGMFGGRIWVESEYGRGSAFHFTACLGAAICAT